MRYMRSMSVVIRVFGPRQRGITVAGADVWLSYHLTVGSRRNGKESITLEAIAAVCIGLRRSRNEDLRLYGEY